MEPDYLEINRKAWNAKVPVHVNSAFYDVKGFLAGVKTLNNIELSLLGDINGKSILHLQCHFGMDTISLARLGAHATGVDFSEAAIAQARELATKTNTSAEFICCDVYALPQLLDKQFDIVFTSYGTIGWLPDMHKWADVVNSFLRPCGHFIIAEFHPVVWMFSNDFTSIQYSYFNKDAIVETLEGTYADRNAPIEAQEIGWNHDLGEVLGALLQQKLLLVSFFEYDYSPYACFSRSVEVSAGKYQIEGLEGKIPLVYALKMQKSGQ